MYKKKSWEKNLEISDTQYRQKISILGMKILETKKISRLVVTAL